MKYLFLQYPKCTTCQKAKKWLDNNNISYEERHIVEKNPTAKELNKWFKKSGLPIKSFFNTSGGLYREMNLKEKVKSAGEDELIKILATNGMLIKRPLIIGDDSVLVGFKEEQWQEKIKEEERIEEAVELNNEELVLKTLKDSEAPMKSGEIAEETSIDKKEVDKIIKNLKKDEKIISPKRCYYTVS